MKWSANKYLGFERWLICCVCPRMELPEIIEWAKVNNIRTLVPHNDVDDYDAIVNYEIRFQWLDASEASLIKLRWM
jgi:hypothetical protein